MASQDAVAWFASIYATQQSRFYSCYYGRNLPNEMWKNYFRRDYMRTTKTQFARRIILMLSLLFILTLCAQPALAAEGDVAINEVNFPDPVFRIVVSGPDIDKNQDGTDIV
jgi:hypothetical protein